MSQELRSEFEIIRDEIEPGANTPERVGGALVRLNDEVDANKIELEQQISQAELNRDNNKGIFGTLALLQAKYPKVDNIIDWYAFVGATNPREKYLVEANGGDWKPTGDMQNVGDVNMADYAKKTELEPLAKKVREDGFKVVYTKDGTTGIEDGEETNWIIPFGKGNREAIDWIFLYEDSSSLVGKKIDTIKFDVQKVGVTTLVVATGAPNALTIKREIDINLTQTGEFTVHLEQPLELMNGEFVGFNTIKKTGIFRVNDTRKNSVAGGYYYYASVGVQGTLSPRDLCVGFGVSTGKSPIAYKDDIVTVSGNLHLGEFTSKEMARNSVDLKYRKTGLRISYSIGNEIFNEFFDSQDLSKWGESTSWGAIIKGKYTPEELIPFYKAEEIVGTVELFFYAEQSAIRNRPLDRIRINAQKAGTLGIYISKNMVVGEPRVDVHSFTLRTTKKGEQILKFPEPITLKDDEWLGVGFGTAGFWVDTTKKNEIGKGYYYCQNTSNNVKEYYKDRNLCVGIIEQGAKENLSIDGISLGDNKAPIIKDSVLDLNVHKASDILSLNKKVTSRLAIKTKTRLVSFMHITDVHIDWVRLSRALDFMNDVKDGCDFGVITGDIVNNAGDDVQPFIDLLKKSIKNTYHCLGNHDILKTVAEVYPKFFEPLADRMGYNNGRNPYYYKDIKEIRFIFLHDFDNSDPSTYYTDAQLSWFIDALRGCKYAIICKHHPIESHQIKGLDIIDGFGKPIVGYNDFFDFNSRTIAPSHYGGRDPIIDIVEAWRTAGSVHYDYNAVGSNTGRVDVDFTESGEFITYLCGHEHYDKFGYVGDTTQLMIVNNCMLMSDVYGDLPRFANTVTQDCINYMNVSLDEKTLTVLRLGSDCAYTGRERKKITVTWDKNKMINA